MRLAPGTYRFKNGNASATKIVRVDNIECGVLAGDTSEFTCNDSITFSESSDFKFTKSTPTAVVQKVIDEGVPVVSKQTFSSKKY